MNALLWIFQVVLAVLYIAGGVYKTFAFSDLAAQMNLIPHDAWRALGLLELVGGILLVVPGIIRRGQSLTPLAATILTIETLGVAFIYSKYSTSIEAENPLVWSVIMAVMVAVVAIGRRTNRSSRPYANA